MDQNQQENQNQDSQVAGAQPAQDDTNQQNEAEESPSQLQIQQMLSTGHGLQQEGDAENQQQQQQAADISEMQMQNLQSMQNIHKMESHLQNKQMRQNWALRDDIDLLEEKGLTEKIYTYESEFQNYAIAFRNRKDNKFRMAVASYLTNSINNQVDIVDLNFSSMAHQPEDGFQKINQFKHEFPPTKIMWIPDVEGARKDILATTGEYLRIWEIQEDTNAYKEHKMLRNRNSLYCAPITSFDWNQQNQSIIGTSSIDTTCTIWDIELQRITMQLIAHDSAVYDISFRDKQMFASCGEDGSARLFDLRNLQTSNIIYDSDKPLLRVAWNKKHTHQLATIKQNCNEVLILDIRQPKGVVKSLKRHTGQVNSIAWAPHSPNHIVTAGDDNQALIWSINTEDAPTDINGNSKPPGSDIAGAEGLDQSDDKLQFYQAGGPIHQLLWCQSRSNWISIAYLNKMQVLLADPFKNDVVDE